MLTLSSSRSSSDCSEQIERLARASTAAPIKASCPSCSLLLQASPKHVGIARLHIQHGEAPVPGTVDDYRNTACTAGEVGGSGAPAGGGTDRIAAAGHGADCGSGATADVQGSGEGAVAGG
jgi:hypothetical protein